MNDPIDIKFQINSEALEKDSQRVTNAILGINDATDKLTKTWHTKVDKQKKAINELEKKLVKLEKKTPSLKDGSESEVLKIQLNEAKQLLEIEKQALKNLEVKLGVIEKSMFQLAGMQATLRAKLAHIKSEGNENSTQYTEASRQMDEVEKTLEVLNHLMQKIGGERHE